MTSTFASPEPAFFSQQVRRAAQLLFEPEGQSQSGGKGPLRWIRGMRTRLRHSARCLSVFDAGICPGRQGTCEAGAARAPLAAGMFYTYGPGTPHEILADSRDPPRKYFVNFAGRSALALLRDCGLPPGSIVAVAGSSMMQHLFDSLIEHGARGGRMAGDLCDGLFKYLLLRISSSATLGDEHLSPAYYTYVNCRDYIERNFARLQTLKQIAAETRRGWRISVSSVPTLRPSFALSHARPPENERSGRAASFHR